VLHPGTLLAPLVLGPAQVPRVDQTGAYRQPWLAVLSALVHGNRPDGFSVALAALVALAELPVPHATLGIDLIMATLDASVRTALEAWMNPDKVPYDPPTDFLRKHYYTGRLQATRQLLVEIAGRRLGGLSEAQRARIDTCEDVDVLQRMAVQVAEATSHEAVARVLSGE
jgi:hypothetical protein